MNSLTSFAEAGFEPIPGYVLREKIGSGGFGEVWLADAPGGLKKALKLVYGSVTDDRAASELRSLQRIRQVNHPFVLSLERIEIINGQLIVVTELADGSLLDKYREMQQRGLAGIPRDKLLRYLSDAADALDFLCQQHDLQHLDVKPANMLLIADHIKIADFGLIKDVQRTNNSMMGGLTPTYAAPEMFDGRPGRSSDQYALAIVYQEMLTGQLPFQGRTTAQLASEHLHKAPNINPLPLHDRAIIAKALSKKPVQRFASCREMIDALIAAGRIQEPSQSTSAPSVQSKIRPTPRSVSPAKSRPAPAALRNDAESGSNPLSTQPRTDSNSRLPNKFTEQFVPKSRTAAVQTLPPVIASQATQRQTLNLFIGLGRTGAETLLCTRQQLHNCNLLTQADLTTSWLALDTDAGILESITDCEIPGAFSANQVINLNIRSAQYYKDRPKELFGSISRRWLYNIPRSQSTEGVRALGMLAYLDHSSECYDAIYSEIVNLIQTSPYDLNDAEPNVYVVSSAHGGTGGAIASEILFLVRRVLAEIRENSDYKQKGSIKAVITAAQHEDVATLELAAASGIVCLTELQHHVNTSGLHPGVPSLPFFPLSVPPIDDLYLIHGGRLGRSSDWRQAIQQGADFLLTDAFSIYGSIAHEFREQLRNGEAEIAHECNPWVRTYCSTQIELSNEMRPTQLSKQFLLESLQRWISAIDSGVAAVERKGLQKIAGDSTTPPARSKKTNQAVEAFCDDLFRDIGWNAQAWVRTCFAQLIPNAQGPERGGTTYDELSQLMNAANADLLRGCEDDLESLRNSLNISIAASRQVASKLMDVSLTSMYTYIRKYWTTHYQNWAFVTSVLNRIADRLRRQAESLRIVSGRFAERVQAIETALEQMVDASATECSQVENERNTVLVQRDVHQLAASLLQRLGELLGVQVEHWSSEILGLRERLAAQSRELAAELFLNIDANGRVLNNYLPLPTIWMQISKETQQAIDDALGYEADALLEFVYSSYSMSAVSRATDERSTDVTSSSPTSPNQSAALQVQNDSQQLPPETSGNTDDPASDVKPDAIQSTLQTMSQLSIKSLRASALAHGIEIDENDSAACPRATLQSLPDILRETTPPLMSAGSAKRLFLIIPEDFAGGTLQEGWLAEFSESVTIIRSGLVDSAKLVVDGERMILSDVINQLWPPSLHRHELAERLHSRVDIDWPEIN